MIDTLHPKKFISKYSSSKIGLLTNQSAFGHWEKGRYHFESYAKMFSLDTVFVPEHGLFAELQDQVSGSGLRYGAENARLDNVHFENLYGDEESSLVASDSTLDRLDCIFVDIRDVGARYYTFLTSAYYLMQACAERKRQGKKFPSFCIIDSPNPAGKIFEGSPLVSEYASFVGVPGTLHRHGLTPGGLLSFYNYRFSMGLKVHVLPVGEVYSKDEDPFLWVPPSPNIPSPSTCQVYAGICLLEGTNLSEGRVTTRPFEVFGAPGLPFQKESLLRELYLHQKGNFILRPLQFQPTFHKHAQKICGGYQLQVLKPKKFHSLLFALHLLKTLSEEMGESFEYLKGVYEFRSDRPAIELLVGDPLGLSYLKGGISYKEISDWFSHQENAWDKLTEDFSY